ncbi:MAG: hypothetical protein QOD48_1489 [Gaiellaceae bacterium]|jgi:hypothetical protein|nr:hypothetical protein [Gaiellaceae bacterium]MDX6525833.1 hypothetical protein [Gaiellales bacterium]
MVVSSEVWFLFLMFGLKVPVFGIGYFLYRVMRAHEDEWEHLGWDEGPSDDDGGGGGGGGGSPSPVPAPRGGPARKHVPRRRPLRTAAGRTLAPVRRPAPMRTRVPRRAPQRG